MQTDDTEEQQSVKMGRRDFLAKSTVAAGAALLGMPLIGSRGALAAGPANPGQKPNILVVIVDEMRYPQWFPAQPQLDSLLPNIAKIRQGGVEFQGHYAAATACSPSRGTLLTGLYAHRTGDAESK